MKKRGLFIGRFQPFHKGHLSALEFIDRDPDVDEIILGLGSSNVSHTPTNPFTAQERREMLKAGVKVKKPYQIIEIPDFNDNPKWTKWVIDNLPEFKVVYTGNPLLKTLFGERGYIIKTIPFEINISGTQIRQLMKDGAAWEEYLPDKVQEFLKKIPAQKRLS